MKGRLILINIFIFVFFFIGFAHAGGSLFPEKLVPCDGPDCNLGKLAEGAGNLLKFLIGITVVGSVLVFAWAGFKYMSNLGDAAKVKQAHGIFKNVAIGLVVVLSAWLIVSTLLKLLTGSNLNERQRNFINLEQDISDIV